MVSFFAAVAVGDQPGVGLAAPPDDGPPYAGASGVACLRGAAGEMLELILRS
jgi:hypothetical protein